MADAFAGRSQVAVLRGEAGVGKSALLGYLSSQADGWHVATTVGVESEMELAYSSLHQLCAPMLDRLDRLPLPQRRALATVFGQSEGPAPDRFMVGLATLTLLAEIAEQQPLLCIVDDAHWLDHASAQVLGFVARRLLAERIAFVSATRTGIGDHVLAGLPMFLIEGLDASAARTLLLKHVYSPLDAAVCDQIVTESRGNPLAILELPRTWSTTGLAGGFGLPDGRPVAGEIEQSYVRRLHELPRDTQLLVLAAAAEPLGDPVLLHRAAEALGTDVTAADRAFEAGLLQVRGRVEFAHPLVRSAAYHAASAEDRRRVHRALAESTDAQIDPDRRAWHRARAAAGPDEDVATDLERSANRAQSRGGIAAAAAFLERAAALTRNPARRADRALAAAEASLQAGAFDVGLELVARAETGPLDEFQRARVELVRSHVAFASGLGSDAPVLLLQAARRLEPFDGDLARETYLTAWVATVFAGHSAEGDVLLEICRAILSLRRQPGDPRPLDLLADGLALLTTDGRAAAVPTLQQAAKTVSDLTEAEVLRWGWIAGTASATVWDPEGWLTFSTRAVQMIRDVGALAELPIQLASHAVVLAWIGDIAAAATFAVEGDDVAAATMSPLAPYGLMRVRSQQGREPETSALIARSLEQAAVEGQWMAAMYAHWAAAVLYNGLARYEEGAASARQATANTFEPWISVWTLPELVEAATRTGDQELARQAVERLAETTQPCGNDAALGIEARCRALLSDGADADDLYHEAIERLGRTVLRPELARAHLLYGEWLRREGKRVDARTQLRMAYDMFDAIGMEAFAERAARELIATGEKARKRRDETRNDLTPQEEQIARLARDGRSNHEIGASLFLSPRTIEWHLGKVFAKLGISSRNGLRAALPEPQPDSTRS